MDNKPYLYWHIQHIDQLGGTEMVSIDLMNHLAPYFNITCIVTAEVKEDIKYDIHPDIKFFYLNIPQEVTRLDAYMLKNKKDKKGYKNFGLIFKVLHHFIFGRFSYRKKIKRLIDEHPGKLISSSGDSYMLAPRKVYSIFHFHFSSRDYFTFGTKYIFHHSRKPDEMVFLTKSSLAEVSARAHLKCKCSFVYNPIRFEGKLNTDYHNNSLVYIGRFALEKNPLFALKIAKELKEANFNFNLEMIGKGPLRQEMDDYIIYNHLQENITISNETKNIKEKLLEKDLLLITSPYEGFPLIKGEAMAYSVPTISTMFGSATEELFTPGIDGYFLNSEQEKDFAKLIIETLKDKERFIKMKKSSYEKSKTLSHESIIPVWQNILK